MAPLAEEQTMMLLPPPSCMEAENDDDAMMVVEESSSIKRIEPLSSSCSSAAIISNKKQKRTTTTKSVTFHDFDEVYDIEHVEDMSYEEITAKYTTQEELATIKATARLYVQAMDDNDNDIGCTNFDSSICLRGLEGHTTISSRKRKFMRQKLVDAMYEIQSFQDKHPSIDVTDIISETCILFTTQSILEAQQIAIKDTIVAMEIYSNSE